MLYAVFLGNHGVAAINLSETGSFVAVYNNLAFGAQNFHVSYLLIGINHRLSLQWRIQEIWRGVHQWIVVHSAARGCGGAQ